MKLCIFSFFLFNLFQNFRRILFILWGFFFFFKVLRYGANVRYMAGIICKQKEIFSNSKFFQTSKRVERFKKKLKQILPKFSSTQISMIFRSSHWMEPPSFPAFDVNLGMDTQRTLGTNFKLGQE
jgi:hypothetical protein